MPSSDVAPQILLLDEPSMGLSPVLVKDVFNIIKDIHNEVVTILLVEQNAKMALSVADNGYVIEVGRIIAEDSAKNLMESKTIRDSYLGGQLPIIQREYPGFISLR